MQWRAAQVLPARRQLFRELHHPTVDLLTLGRAHLVPHRLVAAQQEHVFHASLHQWVERRTLGSTVFMGGLDGPPYPPTLRAPAQPWRFASVAVIYGPMVNGPWPNPMRGADARGDWQLARGSQRGR